MTTTDVDALLDHAAMNAPLVSTPTDTCWYVAKWIPDLERNEPVNIGVIVSHNNRWATRFLPQPAPLTCTCPWCTNSFVTGEWMAYWTRTVEEHPDTVAELATSHTSGDSHYLERGGRLTYGHYTRPIDTLADNLFQRLIVPSDNARPHE